MSRLSVDVDYILKLIAEQRDENGDLNEEDRKRVEREVDSSEKLRLKKDLINKFIEQQDGDTDTEEFYSLMERECRQAIDELIVTENLKADKALQVFAKGFVDLAIPYSGLLVGSMMPPVCRFGAKKNESVNQKHRVVTAMNRIVDTYADSVNPQSLLADV